MPLNDSSSHMSAAAAIQPSPTIDLQARLDEATAAVQAHYRDLLARTVARLVPDHAAAEEALRSGAMAVDGVLVAMRLSPDTDQMEFFADVGLPADHRQEAAYRAVLEMNLCRTHPGVTFGIHPQSGRLVATQAMHALAILDEEVCVGVAGRLARLSNQLRESEALPLA